MVNFHLSHSFINSSRHNRASLLKLKTSEAALVLLTLQPLVRILAFAPVAFIMIKTWS